ncbi:MAG: pyrroline-5-carboxylate reductase [Lentisphaerae bacterium]|nr:pyrroline-5-carboxylate reductase [Lentisphaerota bacterium]
MKPLNKNVVFIGAGNMAEALVRGLLASRLCEPDSITVTDISEERLRRLRESFKVGTSRNNRDAVSGADLVLLAVKPQVLPGVCAELNGCVPARALVVSIAAGIATPSLEQWLGPDARVVRVMPNMPALVREGASAFCLGRQAGPEDARLVKSIFKSVGFVVRLDESQMDAVTALSGSGPAYVFMLMEAMRAAARDMGVDETVAQSLVNATISGAVRLQETSGLPPEELRRRVTSPGGTTAAALSVLERGKVMDTWVAAILAARNRASELSGPVAGQTGA